MPSNILYGTPSISEVNHSIRRAVSGSPVASGGMEIPIGASQQVEQMLKRALSQTPTVLAPFQIIKSWGREGTLLALQERYDEARDAFEKDSAKVATWKGKRFWLAICLQNEAAIMGAASHPGCPQTLSLRLTQVLTRRLMIERQTYLALPSEEQSPEDQDYIMSSLVGDTQYWTQNITIRKALKIWPPSLKFNSAYNILEKRLTALRPQEYYNLEDILWNRSRRPTYISQPLQQLLHHPGRGVVDKLLDLVPLLGFSTDGVNAGIKEEMLAQCRGRSFAFVGGYYSFLGQYEKAEQAFHESARALETEPCVEIKLHRMLWHSEHYTRVQNWAGVSVMLYEAHRTFMAQETTSTFVLSHFPDRFRLLCKAVSACVPIDEVVHEMTIFNRENPDRGNERSFRDEAPQAPSPVLEVERLFPLGSTDHSTIDVNAWRQYVTFSP